MRTLTTILLGCLIVSIMALSACDYPEQGYYALVGMDGDGKRVAYLPFMVDELTDDTHMTFGFTVLLPRFGELVEIPLQNGEDLTRRYWQLAIADADTGAGDLAIELEHGEERLQFSGKYRQAASAVVQQLSGFMVPMSGGKSQMVFDAERPELPSMLEDVLYFEIHPVERSDFEDFLGVPVDKARRVPATVADSMEQAAAADNGSDQPESQPEGSGDSGPQKPKSPVLGGKR